MLKDYPSAKQIRALFATHKRQEQQAVLRRLRSEMPALQRRIARNRAASEEWLVQARRIAGQLATPPIDGNDAATVKSLPTASDVAKAMSALSRKD